MEKTASAAPRNALASATSPYLKQHAGNPVDWYPWGPEALGRARAENKPILLSIGYSACHWCHVMAHESFEDTETAALMNKLFVNIKVDREERPDLDRIYQIAHQMLSQRGGGWPLTMFLTPDDHTPFVGGTYFPREARYGLIGFKDLLVRVEEYFRAGLDEIRSRGDLLREAFGSLNPPADPAAALDREPIAEARRQLAASFDPQYGGFGSAPKFPHPTNIERLLRDWRASALRPEPDLDALYMATRTLRSMAEGGLYDQLAGGFSRYSVDRWWMIPHFEKMLYDNGPLLALYAQAATATGDAFYRSIALETAAWVMRDMQSPEGGYYSTLDADSEGHEGKFYVWDRAEVESMLSPAENALFARRFGLDREPNFEDRHWHLHIFESIETLATGSGQPTGDVARILDGAREKLRAVRERRIWPGRDEKILVGWNGLMVRGMAIAARHLRRPGFAESATRAVDFIRERMWIDGRLTATYKDGKAHLAAYLDDYVFLAEALLELLQVRWRSADLEFARALIDAVLAHFTDPGNGGFYFTADDHEALLHRSKTFGDDATPAGNGVAALVLNRLGLLLGETRYLDAAERTLRAGWAPLAKYPQAHTTLLNALDELLAPVETVIVRGPATEATQWQAELAALYAPNRQVFAIADDETQLPAALAEKKPGAGTLAYVCTGTTCDAPVASLPALVRRLRDGVKLRPAK
ncbi:MAG TPA: thioredoxin domain-containing protein [Steroidobacteraceae bacterium]|nr:thioredoxin domain-containing protein [Steroidobacteraceae bacterium]